MNCVCRHLVFGFFFVLYEIKDAGASRALGCHHALLLGKQASVNLAVHCAVSQALLSIVVVRIVEFTDSRVIFILSRFMNL